MIKRLLQYGWSVRREFAMYFAIGVTSFVFDLGSLYLFDRYTSVPHYVAVIINQPIILLSIFFLNKHWSFGAKGFAHRQLVRFAILSGANYLFAVFWMWLFTDFFHLHFLDPETDYLLVRTANVALAVGWNFVLYRHWVYSVAQ